MRVKQLKLTNFRKFKNFTIDLDSPLTIIHADNAEGKSTIIEALYYITNQYSPFTSETGNLMSSDQESAPYFRIEIDIEVDDSSKKYAIYQNNGSKQYFIDQHRTIKKKFDERLASTLFSPEQIDLLMVSPQKRRDFLDSLISRIDLDHSEALKKMRQTLKQRNAYIKRLSKRFYETGRVQTDLISKDQQLIYWSELLASVSSKIMINRAKYLERVSGNELSLVYKPSIAVGEFTEMMKSSQLEELHMEKFEEFFKRDVALAHTTIGAHRDDWDIIMSKDIRKFGSRGEKRLAIGRIIITSQQIYFGDYGDYPLLLLDDISSELDQKNAENVLDEALLDQQQTIITAIRLEDIPERVRSKAKVIQLTRYPANL